MAKLYFRHGAMDSSKTANLLMVAYNYKKQGKNPLILKPALDVRGAKGIVESRVGVKEQCVDVPENEDLYNLAKKQTLVKKIDCILVDECQFLKKEQILQLVKVVDELDIPVICYGLKNSFIPGEIFEGSKALLYYAESIEEIKTVCNFCDKKATMNLRVVNNKPVYSGEQITMGDTSKQSKEYFLPVCRKHYLHPPDDIEGFEFK